MLGTGIVLASWVILTMETGMKQEILENISKYFAFPVVFVFFPLCRHFLSTVTEAHNLSLYFEAI